MCHKLAIAWVVLLLAASPGIMSLPSASATTPGSGADSALPIPSGSVTVATGERIWYGFQYAGDDSAILIDMSAEPGGSAGFSVWTASDVRNWAAGQGEQPTGRGSEQTMSRRLASGDVEEIRLYGGDLIWSGSFRSAGVYYVVVDQAGPSPATINLKVTGTGVSAIPGPVGQAAAPPAARAPARATPVPTACIPVVPLSLTAGGAGSAPGQALALPSTDSYLLGVGQRAWYAFRYVGDGSQILIDLRATPEDSAGFAVYTPGDTGTPVGRGSPQTMSRRLTDGTVEKAELYGGDLIWSGSFRAAGVYYVAVEQTGASPSTMVLGISGSGVSGGQPVSALPGNSAPGPTCAPPAAASPAAMTLPAGGAGSAPGQALALPSAGSYLLGVGQRAWYAFRYAGDGSQILIDLRATPEDSAGFAVYTPGDLETPVGRGSPQTMSRRLTDGTVEKVELYGGDPIWSGSFGSAGVYYVAVSQAGANLSTITLGISGAGVSAP